MMSFLNPFHEVFETRQYPHAHTYRTSFGQKLWATFKVFAGNVMAKSAPDNTKNSELDSSSLHFGVIDYLSCGIYYALNALPLIFLGLAPESVFLRVICTLAISILAIPRFIFGVVMTLICAIPVGIVTAIASFEGDRLKNEILTYIPSQASTDEVLRKQANSEQFKPKTDWEDKAGKLRDVNKKGASVINSSFQTILQTTGLDLDDLAVDNIEMRTFNEINSEPQTEMMEITFKGETGARVVLDVKHNTTDQRFFKNLCALNIGGLQTKIETDQNMHQFNHYSV